MVGTNNLGKAKEFYDAVLVHLDLKRVVVSEEGYIGYSHSGEDQEVKFYVTQPHNKKEATFGNGTMIALSAKTRQAVDKFHAEALKNGATNEGSPGIRSDGNYYGYIRDLDGNKLAARYIE